MTTYFQMDPGSSNFASSQTWIEASKGLNITASMHIDFPKGHRDYAAFSLEELTKAVQESHRLADASRAPSAPR